MEKERAEFCTKIDASINEANICVSEANRYSKYIWRGSKLTSVGMDGRFYLMLGVQKGIGQRLGVYNRDRGDTRDRD